MTEAYDYLIERRPIVDPNIGFLLQLVRYEKRLRKNDSIQRELPDTMTREDNDFIESQTTRNARHAWPVLKHYVAFADLSNHFATRKY